MEIIVFANFNFEISRTTTKVIVSRGVVDEERFVLNWAEYQAELEANRLKPSPGTRPFYDRYSSPRQDDTTFKDLIKFQLEIIKLLRQITDSNTVPFEAWETIFREAEKRKQIVLADPPVRKAVGPEDLEQIKFTKHVIAESYRAVLFGELRDLILSRRVFRLRCCPECGLFFMDHTRNASKVYCSSAICGNRAKQRAFHQRRAARRNLDQKPLEFGETAEMESDDTEESD